MWTVIEFIFEFFSFREIFGNTGRLFIKGITFGQVDLDLDRWLPCFIAVVIGLIFWGLILFACLLLFCPGLFDMIGELKGGSL